MLNVCKLGRARTRPDSLRDYCQPSAPHQHGFEGWAYDKMGGILTCGFTLRKSFADGNNFIIRYKSLHIGL